MDGFDLATSFGPGVAREYAGYVRGDEPEAVAFLADLAGAGPALEFAVGTGRIAIPLAARGIRVDGIELSPDMVEQLRAKPGGADLAVAMGDMSTTAVSGSFRLVYLVFNTIGNLLTQDGQVRCFENASRHLTDDGVFVVETGVLHGGLTRPDFVNPEHIAKDRVVFDVCHYDPVTQLLDENHVELSGSGIRLNPIVCRLASHSELDLMARIAGLRLRERWGGWQRQPFTADSVRHVSVYQKPT